MKLRRNGAIALVLGIIMMLVAGGPARAVDVPPPVVDYPAVPSQLVKALTNSPIGNATLKMALALSAAAQSAPTVKPPVPITPAAALTRGATGGPLVGSFFAGFAIGTGGLMTYQAVTGVNPLGTLCGSGFEVAGTIMYAGSGMVPTCSATVVDPNFGSPSSIEFSAGRSVTTHRVTSGAYTYIMLCGGGSALTSGQTLGVTFNAGGADSTTYNNLATSNSLCVTAGSRVAISNCYAVHSGLPANQLCTAISVKRSWIQSSGGTLIEEGVKVQANPLRTPRCTVRGGGMAYTANGTPYREPDGVPVSAEALGCGQAYQDFISVPGRGPGFLPDRIEVESVDGDTGAITKIADQPVPGEYTPDQQKGLQQGNGRGLVLEKIVGNKLLSCMTWAADCSSWWTATSNGTTESTSTGTYKCTYAGQPISLAECGVYRDTFDLETTTPTVTDPVTGEPTPWPTGTPSTSTGTGTFPSTGSSPGAAVSTATGGGGCTAGWSWNPVDWVLNPIRCAFIPSTESVDGTIAALGESAGSVAAVDPLLALLDTLPGAGGCEGIPVELSFFGQTASGHLLAACDGFGATAAAVVNGLMTLGIATGAVIAVTRYAAAVFGFVGPGGGIQQQEYSNHMMARSAARSD